MKILGYARLIGTAVSYVCVCVWSRIEPLAYAEAYFCVSVQIFYVCVCACGLETKSECPSVGIFEKGVGCGGGGDGNYILSPSSIWKYLIHILIGPAPPLPHFVLGKVMGQAVGKGKGARNIINARFTHICIYVYICFLNLFKLHVCVRA